MTLVTVRPAIQRKPTLNIDRWLDELFYTQTPVRANIQARATRPAPSNPPVNVIELGNAFQIQFAAPGMEKSDFEVKLEKEFLTISGKQETAVTNGETFRRREFGNYTFKRHFQLPADTVDVNAIEADYANGILTVSIPKREEAQEKPVQKIEVA